MLYVGIDLGTSAVKLLLMDETGHIHKIVSKEYPLYSLIRDGQSRSLRTGMSSQWQDLRSC